jgi:cysteinyl-tRNA synthetase
MTLRIYNTLSRSKQVFTPIEPNKIRLYVCGMTVYDYCHLGHARVLVAFDVITRYLRAVGYDVDYVRNITDIDDKILNRAIENGELFSDLTSRFINHMHEDEARLGVLPPDHEPRATAHIDDIIAMVQVLIDKDYAYVADNGDVYYAVSKFVDYGRLSGKDPEQLLAGARIETGELKRDHRDFALWKSVAEDGVYWEAPWGRGRPGWHIECSAMSKSCLGDHFDIHGGGPDLPFPHHENEIAQSEAANACTFVNYWMHAGAVRVDGEKMSKSLGNFFTIRDILAQYHPETVRYVLIGSHYRSAINYSEDNLKTARGALERMYTALRGLGAVPALTLSELDADNDYVCRFRAAMDDDFNTPVALAVIFDLVRALNSARSDGRSDNIESLATLLKSLATVLGLLQEDAEVFLKAGGSDSLGDDAIEALIKQRIQAKLDKDYTLADTIRNQLKDQGVVLEDTRDGTVWKRA